MKYSITQVPIR